MRKNKVIILTNIINLQEEQIQKIKTAYALRHDLKIEVKLGIYWVWQIIKEYWDNWQ